MSKKKVTNKNDIIELRVKRFLAMVIDWYLTNMLAVIPITFYFRNGDYLQPYMFDFTHYDFQTALLLILYGIAIGLIYYIIIPVFLWKGQTLGKKICKIQIVDINENNITLKTMLLRELVGATLLEGGIVITATYLRKLLPVLGFTSFVEPLKYLAYGLTLLSILYAYFQPNSQSFHDKIAQTIIKKNKLYFPSFRDIYNIIICWEDEIMKYNFINDSYKIDFNIPDGLKKEIEYLEQLDRDNDYSFFNYAEDLEYSGRYYVRKGIISKNSGSNYIIDMEDFKNKYKWNKKQLIWIVIRLVHLIDLMAGSKERQAILKREI